MKIHTSKQYLLRDLFDALIETQYKPSYQQNQDRQMYRLSKYPLKH